ncbi:MAG: hypothetical protein K1060chlam5_00064 [Candidatus Anoxychlamydiales bacterium]|nr:hypothetical protein [Candidatus Anoxychlamydiales bacterium]
MEAEIIKKSFGTHDGSFHADEITACALLLLYDLIDRNKIHRTRDLVDLSKCEYVCDVGGIYVPNFKRFDHHQKGYAGEMSSAGMVLLYLKEKAFIDPTLYDYFNKVLVRQVDAHDIGKMESKGCSFSQVIANFSPIDYNASKKERYIAFMHALDFAYGHLLRMRDRFFYIKKCSDKVKKTMEGRKKYLIFEESIPWIDGFFELNGESHPALFLIMPTERHWKLRAIPPDNNNRMMVRLPLPLEWAGLQEEELKKASNVEGAIFCHKGRFISVWKTKEDAIKALKYTLNKARIDYGNDI